MAEDHGDDRNDVFGVDRLFLNVCDTHISTSLSSGSNASRQTHKKSNTETALSKQSTRILPRVRVGRAAMIVSSVELSTVSSLRGEKRIRRVEPLQGVRF